MSQYRIINLANGRRLEDDGNDQNMDDQQDTTNVKDGDDKAGGYGDSSGFADQKADKWIG